ncbi:zinc-dependent alcohol dehydrogenase [Ferviditalea candida]|uniref:Alcohol dehydrogenase catalytic domain-containing protein n=1 Tax=Ferviditalea candida TaxID=3108399 RepID=A0ABU5ZKA5_9BACL|nr:alcohol dehydrogenase catalytic domain-containing protein [Paenibacillaceae bacterium T2]
MKAVIVESAYTVVVKNVSKPVIGEHEVLIKVKTAGICGSDIHTYKGIHPFRKPPVVIGHEVSGEVVEVGSRTSKVKVGDHVTVEPQYGCGKCEPCFTGRIHYCANRSAPGIGNWYGTMAEYFAAPEECVFVVPKTMDYQLSVLAEPLAVGVHAVRKADLRVGERVAILGAGPIGLLTLSAAKAAGATVLMATDVLDYALEHAVKLGATHTLNIRGRDNWAIDAKKIAGGEFDKVFVAAGAPGIINQALSLLRKGGRAVAVAMFHGEQPLDVIQLQGMEKELIGSFTYMREDTRTAIDLLLAGSIPFESIVSHVLPYSEADKGFRLVDKKEDQSMKVLITF